MGFLDRIAECNAHDLSRFLPFRIPDPSGDGDGNGAADGPRGGRAGWIRHAFAERLAAHDDVFDVDARQVTLAPGLSSFETRSAAVDDVVHALDASGVLPLIGSELYPVAPAFGAAPWMQLERSALPAFGVRAYGIHMHGVVREGDALRLWIARRAKDKPTFPGMLDNMVAGGQPIGLSLRDNLIKECAEEAAIPPELAARARPTGVVTYKVETERGLKDDVLFLYELELPPDFVPRNTDGEVESFELWDVEHAMDVVANTRDFKFNCNLALIDFFVRHGYIAPEHPDYVEIVRGLHR